MEIIKSILTVIGAGCVISMVAVTLLYLITVNNDKKRKQNGKITRKHGAKNLPSDGQEI